MIPVDSFYPKLNSVHAVVAKRKDDLCHGISWETLRHIHNLVCLSQLIQRCPVASPSRRDPGTWSNNCFGLRRRGLTLLRRNNNNLRSLIARISPSFSSDTTEYGICKILIYREILNVGTGGWIFLSNFRKKSTHKNKYQIANIFTEKLGQKLIK